MIEKSSIADIVQRKGGMVRVGNDGEKNTGLSRQSKTESTYNALAKRQETPFYVCFDARSRVFVKNSIVHDWNEFSEIMLDRVVHVCVSGPSGPAVDAFAREPP